MSGDCIILCKINGSFDWTSNLSALCTTAVLCPHTDTKNYM